ncbi:MspA family porin [Gordonia sputi]|uniref:MspA family porin n=1 Tax=Gordonia sputi TaxID=36823 RepID=UPI00204411C9|nr:MspA family porin [Gordonia sputi]MCM3895752.1 MspA family porin [Gordonia sputi]
MKKSYTRRLAAVAAVAGAAAMGLSGVSAGNADAGPLPGGKVTKTLVDGTPVSITLSKESISVQRPINQSALSREAWGSGTVSVNVGGKAKGGSIKVGYELGCQVNFGASAELKGGADVKPGAANPNALGGADAVYGTSAGGTGGVTLGPGGVTKYWLISGDSLGNSIQSSDVTNKDDDNYTAGDLTFTGSTGGVTYSQEHFVLNGCAGYASARTIVQVTVKTDSVKGIVTYTGKPFSLG